MFINTPIEICEQRDPKGLYKKARAGEIKGFTGIDDPYESPTDAQLELDTGSLSIEQSVELLITELECRGILPNESALNTQ